MIIGRLLGSILGQSRSAAPAGRALRQIEQGEARLKCGDVRGAAHAFEAAVARAPGNARLHYRIAAAYIDTGMHAEAEGELERCIALDPAFADAYVRLGNIHQLNGDDAHAERRYRTALELDRAAPLAHYNLGSMLRGQVRTREALQHFRSAYAATPLRREMLRSYVLTLLDCEEYEEAVRIASEAANTDAGTYESWYCLGLAYQRRHRYADALACYDKAVQLKPGDADSLTYRAMTLHELGRLPEAFADYDAALAARPGDPLARFHKSLASLFCGDYASAWPDYETRLLSDDVPRRPHGFPRWDGSPPGGRRILIYGEQGLGDEIMFASCIPDILRSGARCVIECNPSLRALFASSFPEATVYAAAPDKRVPDAVREAGIDCEVPIGSLALHYRTSSADFPRHTGYLTVEAERVSEWRARLKALGPGRNIGISWRGGTYKSRSPLRSIDLDRWLPIFRVPGLNFVSLQYTPDAPSDLARLLREHGIPVAHWPEALTDYENTAALVRALDLTVTVCTSIVHLAGGLGRPVWVMAPHTPEWRYGRSGDHLPWYPSAQLFRQGPNAQWDEVIDGVATRLAGGNGR